MFDIISGFCVEQLLKRTGCDLLNKVNSVLEKVLDNEEFMEFISGDPVIYVCSSKEI